jgi:predicted phosphodiesterase
MSINPTPPDTELPDAELRAGVTCVPARRIGLIGDDHNTRDDAGDLPPQVLTALDGVDLIVHLGHMGFRDIPARAVLDRLAAIAPVLAVRDYSTTTTGEAFLTPADGTRVAGLTRVIEAGDLRIGAVHNPARPPGPKITTPPGGLPQLDDIPVTEVLADKFGTPVDVVAYASSHRPAALLADGVLFVNPGSPTYPKGPGRTPGQRTLGTVGILDVAGGVAAFEVLELSLFG